MATLPTVWNHDHTKPIEQQQIAIYITATSVGISEGFKKAAENSANLLRVLNTVYKWHRVAVTRIHKQYRHKKRGRW